MTEKLSDDIYLHISPTVRNGIVRDITIDKTTKTKPRKSTGLVIKVHVKIPVEVFDPLIPEVVIDVPTDRVEVVPDVSIDPPTVYTREGEEPIDVRFEDEDDEDE